MKARRKQVMMMAGGGLTHVSGGVGTFIRYLTDEWATKPGAPQVRDELGGHGVGIELCIQNTAAARERQAV